MRLTLGTRSFDLTTSALVMGTVGHARSVTRAMAEGADIVEVGGVEDLEGHDVIWCVAPADDAVLRSAVAAGADLIRLGPGPSLAAYRLCAAAGAAVVVAGATAAERAEASGVPADRIVVEEAGPGRHPVLVDVTGCACPLAATAAGVVRGARIVRTADVRAARRACDVLAAVWTAGP